MNTIEELIQKECPEGVEFKALGEVCEIAIGEFVHKNFQNDAYPYPVYNGGTSNTGFYKEYNREAHNVIISARGANAGYVNKVETRYWAGNSCYSIWSKNDLILSFYFLFYVLKYNEKNLIKSQEKGGGLPAISKKQIQLFEIPVPPLSVQHKIVEILDKFTSLEAELEAELEARKKQYEYYRNQLLDFTGREDVEWKTLGECGEFIRGGGLQKKDFTETGFPCIHYGQIHTRYNTHTSHTVAFTSEEYASKLKKAQYGDLLIATTSEDVDACCKAVTWLGNSEVAVSGDMYIYRHTQNPRFMSYLFKTKQFADYKKTAATGTKVVRVSGDSMANFKFAFPSLAEQEKIASILDKFEALINGQTASLAAEIKARHQQYEYYRDKLLSFKRKD